MDFLHTDCTDQLWLNPDTGARIVLAANGGWRQAQGQEEGPSEYRVLYRAPDGTITDETWAFLHDNGACDKAETGLIPTASFATNAPTSSTTRSTSQNSHTGQPRGDTCMQEEN